MFLIFGIDGGEDRLDFVQNVICSVCGSYGRIEVYVVYSVFTLFFLPVFRFGKKYYARMSCCGATCTLSKETGKAVEKKRISEIPEEELRFTGTGYRHHCAYCGFDTDEDFQYCPKCGRPF